MKRREIHRNYEFSYLFTLTGRNAINNGVVIIEDNGRYTSEHLLEVLLQTCDVLAVTDDFEEILVAHEVKPKMILTVQVLDRELCVGWNKRRKAVPVCF